MVHGGSERISKRAREAIEGVGGVRALSVPGAWEMATKANLDKVGPREAAMRVASTALGRRWNRTPPYRDSGRRACRHAAVFIIAIRLIRCW